MALPDNFSPFEHLQSTIMSVQNKIISREFRDVDRDWEANGINISTPRASLRYACTLQDNDSASMAILRLFFYYFCLRKAADLQVPVYGIPVPEYQEKWKFRPQVVLYFVEDQADVELGYSPVMREVSFRLMNESSETITKANATTLANKIYTELGTNGGYRHHTGWHKATYFDAEKGYDFRILTYDKAQAKALVEKILSIQGHAYDGANFGFGEKDSPAAAFPISQPARNIYGQFRRSPRKRPVAWVRFRRADMLVHGMTHPVVLCDLTGVKADLRT